MLYMKIDGPFILEPKNFKKFKKKKPDLEQIEEYSGEYDQAAMFLAGCKPIVPYYKWGPDMDKDDNFHERDEIFSDLEEIILESGEPMPWEELAEHEVVKYYKILKVAKKGYSTWDEIPDK